MKKFALGIKPLLHFFGHDFTAGDFQSPLRHHKSPFLVFLLSILYDLRNKKEIRLFYELFVEDFASTVN